MVMIINSENTEPESIKSRSRLSCHSLISSHDFRTGGPSHHQSGEGSIVALYPSLRLASSICWPTRAISA